MDKNKEELLLHFEHSIDFVKKLEEISEELWRTPIGKNKWTVAEIIGHFPPWDEFVLNERLPNLFKDTPLSKVPNEEELNCKSAEISRNRSKEDTISNFINIRRKLIIAIHNIEDEFWKKELPFDNNSLTLFDYMKGFMDHDLHHFKQINKLVTAHSINNTHIE